MVIIALVELTSLSPRTMTNLPTAMVNSLIMYIKTVLLCTVTSWGTRVVTLSTPQ